MIAAAGAGLAPERPDIHSVARLETDQATPSRPPAGLSGATARTETASPDNPASTNAPKKVERMHSKSRREHASGHHHSHSSRHHKDDQHKNVGEYALHVLFTSVRAAPTLSQDMFSQANTVRSSLPRPRRSSMTALRYPLTRSPLSSKYAVRVSISSSIKLSPRSATSPGRDQSP